MLILRELPKTSSVLAYGKGHGLVEVSQHV